MEICNDKMLTQRNIDAIVQVNYMYMRLVIGVQHSIEYQK